MRGANAYQHDGVIFDRHGSDGRAGDLLLRVASVVGEIEALKRERHREELRASRVEFASVYFRKRQGAVPSATGKTAPPA